MDALIEFARQAYWKALTIFQLPLSADERLYWPFLLVFFLPVLWRARRDNPWRGLASGDGGYWARVFPRALWLHPSSRLDLAICAINTVITPARWALALGSTTTVALWVSTGLASVMPSAWHLPWNGYTGALYTVLALLAADFGIYLTHRAFHEVRWLWPLHALHHSAEVLTPLTHYRQHPLYMLVSAVVRGLLVGSLQGFFYGLTLGRAEASTLLGVNVLYMLLFMPLANFRHSQFWIDFGPRWSRWLISPAMHQVHHSRRAEHWDKNYGEMLAIWDRLFGTLYLPAPDEHYELGLSNREDMPGHTLVQAYLRPLRRMRQALHAPAPGAVPDSAATRSTQA